MTSDEAIKTLRKGPCGGRACEQCRHVQFCEYHAAVVAAIEALKRPHGECKTCKHFVKNGFDGIKYVCEHPEIQLDDYYDYACIMMEDNDFCSRYEPREKEGDVE